MNQTSRQQLRQELQPAVTGGYTYRESSANEVLTACLRFLDSRGIRHETIQARRAAEVNARRFARLRGDAPR